MEFFQKAKTVRLRNRHEKYLVAEEDEESVTQERNGSSKAARWIVEFIQDGNFIRLKSCYGKYLTASNAPFLLGMTGNKVLQTLPRRLDSSIEWEPIKDGLHVKLKTRYGNFLRANGGLPPWRNSVTHDIPHRTATQDWILWDVDVLEIQVHADSPKPRVDEVVVHPISEPSSPRKGSNLSKNYMKLESSGSFVNSTHKAVDGRMIYYTIADDNGNVEDGIEGECFNFKGNGVYELTHKLEEETGLEDIIVCTQSPLNGKLYPLKLQLPPNNTTMHVVVVPSSSRAGRGFTKPDSQ
ncbi:putative actin cross-linking protein [Thalictrum thalictroides]|uniref:Putative actin cross-linking protein n=1 Tax=Thalictrum thalictroides TaxID=46969 RepID=A0A7J6WKR2_THATH|nr:putative actin cross-linking protein [Thalictrum thalictroides]